MPTGGEVMMPPALSPPSTPVPQDPPVNGAGTTRSPTSRKGEEKSATAAVVVGRISFCGHPELHGTLCTSCGRNVVPPGAKANGGRRKGDAAAAGGGGGNGAGGRGAGGREEGDAEGDHDHDHDHVGDTHQVLMKGGKVMSVTAEGVSVSQAGRRRQTDR